MKIFNRIKAWVSAPRITVESDCMTVRPLGLFGGSVFMSGYGCGYCDCYTIAEIIDLAAADLSGEQWVSNDEMQAVEPSVFADDDMDDDMEPIDPNEWGLYVPYEDQTEQQRRGYIKEGLHWVPL